MGYIGKAIDIKTKIIRFTHEEPTRYYAAQAAHKLMDYGQYKKDYYIRTMKIDLWLEEMREGE